MTVAPTALTAPAVRARIASVPASLWLVGLVLLSLVARVVVGAWHVAPRIFPDEYIYASLGRSLAEGSFTIRGESAGFPAVLEPAAAAPLWLLAGDNLELGYRLVQGMHALVVSLTAIPVYVLARRLHLSVGVGLACAGLTLLLPVLAWSPAIMADTFALPFVLGAVTAATIALDRPRPATQAAFLLLAGLATLARIQYVVLPVAFLVAALVVSRGSVRQVVRSFRVTVAVLGAGLLVVAAVGTQRLLGYYEGISDLRIDAVNVGRWLGSDLLLLAYASGLVLVPLALVGLIAGVARPRFTTERAFASFVKRGRATPATRPTRARGTSTRPDAYARSSRSLPSQRPTFTASMRRSEIPS